jgi:hypothetical protein
LAAHRRDSELASGLCCDLFIRRWTRKFADPFGDRRDDTKPVSYCLVGREDMYDLADPVVAEAGILGLAVPNAPAQALDLLKDRCLGMLPVIPG